MALKWTFPLFIVILLPLYYKIIWPPIIGYPARAETVDVLAFWGAVFGGIITLIGVFLTIRYSKNEMEQKQDQEKRDQFIKEFGSTVLEINSIVSEMNKFSGYLQKLKTNLLEYSNSRIFNEIIIEFDEKEDYKKIGKDIKPNLEIISNRFEGKAAHANGFVYYLIHLLSKDIQAFQTQLHEMVDDLGPNDNRWDDVQLQKFETLFQNIHQSLTTYKKELKDYKEQFGVKFIEYAKQAGLLE